MAGKSNPYEIQGEFGLDKSKNYNAQLNQEEEVIDPSGPVTEHEKAIADYAAKQKQQQTDGGGTTETEGYVPGQFYKQFEVDYKGREARTPEQIKAEEERQQRKMRLAAIGDALSAFNVAYSNARGVKPVVNPGDSLTGKLRERYDRLNKEQEAKDQAFMTARIRAQQMDAQNAISWEQLKQRKAEHEAAEKRREQERQEKLDYQKQLLSLKEQAEEEKKRQFDEKNQQGAFSKKSSGKRYASKKVVGNTTIYYDKDGKVVKTVEHKPGTGHVSSNSQNSTGNGQQQTASLLPGAGSRTGSFFSRVAQIGKGSKGKLLP